MTQTQLQVCLSMTGGGADASPKPQKEILKMKSLINRIKQSDNACALVAFAPVMAACVTVLVLVYVHCC